jgi:hypothetical protein
MVIVETGVPAAHARFGGLNSVTVWPPMFHQVRDHSDPSMLTVTAPMKSQL